ncbi:MULTISPECIES: helix-turn-helix domain-containing protein [Saccharopolyspora]|uniref:HTH cro/C1-type domain-containing protein n=1 Tax=Saccharopolyspora gregorii TaxID=33914 RepID=A0ABP6RMQ7_9PSEU|nr:MULTISPECIES: helix-turn-helix transcriptional regulator [Saccharopolyspora]MCA1186922.1 helix-turn-helix domain-containing protein [Saccharopolyspora sp. 6T]MCA1193315.1 helix-turn-helix domain-containing protein [Saccharopolyspora sp. 6V]MCA1228918.1 helix-turn-helix domain-containing protein [Saccharopolyspora sp. 6M]MCA1281406.1 helix-turn-helix domain-containing protein [Saccharopolyspora sp. 7B]
MTVLLREAVGERLRRARTAQSRTLRDVSRAARVSLGYLSEVERGRKEASSELLASICGALDLPLPELLVTVAGDLDGSGTVLTPAMVEQRGAADFDGGRLVPSLMGADLADTELSGADFADAETAGVEAQLSSEDLTEEHRLQPVLSQRISAPVRSSGGVVVAA